MRFIVTTHRRLSGARLSLAGNWGNRQFETVEAAQVAAREIAGSSPFTIEREHF